MGEEHDAVPFEERAALMCSGGRRWERSQATKPYVNAKASLHQTLFFFPRPQEFTIVTKILGYPSLHPSKKALGMNIKMPMTVRLEAQS